ncbi:hypothetical protein L7G72_16460 [Xenorhabdus bovienii]|nr:hypothetical protein [Xenorhabdus bovienii]MCG3463396.1 hypothetical protein [Xenorhabdus bovienii]
MDNKNELIQKISELLVDNGMIKPLSHTEEYRRKNYAEIEIKYYNM